MNGRNSKKLQPLSARGSTKNKKVSKSGVVSEDQLAPENETIMRTQQMNKSQSQLNVEGVKEEKSDGEYTQETKGQSYEQ